MDGRPMTDSTGGVLTWAFICSTAIGYFSVKYHGVSADTFGRSVHSEFKDALSKLGQPAGFQRESKRERSDCTTPTAMSIG